MSGAALPRTIMLAIALVQGVVLYLLYRSEAADSWPSATPVWAFPLWTLAVAVPLLAQLTITRENLRRATAHIGALAIALAGVAAYTGWQATPDGAFPVASIVGVFSLTLTLACFKALMYIQQRADGLPASYPVLFTNSWRNFLIGGLAALFTGVFWLILLLWAQLFAVIGIDFFDELFTQDWFLIPVLTVAFGIGISLFRALTPILDNITRLLHWLIKLLLPLVLGVAIVFLAALPFTGLDVLWGTGSGTALLLWLLAALLFFVNAVYQDGREVDPYPALLHRAIFLGLCVTPILAALSLYGLLLRVGQHGWTVERFWAFVVWLVLALFAFGYVVGIVRRGHAWTAELARVNRAMGLILLAILLLANSPLVDFRKLSLASQLDRVAAGEIARDELDFWYINRHLGRPGYLERQRMIATLGDSDDERELRAKIEEPMPPWSSVPIDFEEFWDVLHLRPEPYAIPDGLKQKVEATVGMVPGGRHVMVRADLDRDGMADYALVTLYGEHMGPGFFFYRRGEQWHSEVLDQSVGTGGRVWKQVLEGPVTVTDPIFMDLRLGDVVLRPHPTAERKGSE